MSAQYKIIPDRFSSLYKIMCPPLDHAGRAGTIKFRTNKSFPPCKYEMYQKFRAVADPVQNN